MIVRRQSNVDGSRHLTIRDDEDPNCSLVVTTSKVFGTVAMLTAGVPVLSKTDIAALINVLKGM
jgi:hypothetical protein